MVWRTFFAIHCDSETRDRCLDVMQLLKKHSKKATVRWVAPQNLHITLRFMGETQPEQVPALIHHVTQTTAGCQSFQAHLGAVGLFPPSQKPKVIAFSPTPTANFSHLVQAIEQGVIAAGFPAETRPFHSHLTLGRIVDKHIPQIVLPTILQHDFVVDEIVLFRSENTPYGVSYTVLARIPLK